MPMISIQFATPRAKTGSADKSGNAAAVATAARQLSADILHKDPAVTAVVVEEIDPTRWFIADKSLADHDLASFWLAIRIVDGTNTREDKAAFVAAAFAAMNRLIGPLHPESYVHVDDVRGDAYGYGGLTQNERYIAGKLQAAARVAA